MVENIDSVSPMSATLNNADAVCLSQRKPSSATQQIRQRARACYPVANDDRA